MLKNSFKIVAITIIVAILYYSSAVATGAISTFSNNIDLGAFAIIFDSQITIAYLLVYYSLASFYKMSPSQNYVFFVFTLLLSFTTNFIQGSLTLLLAIPLLKRLNLITPPTTSA